MEIDILDINMACKHQIEITLDLEDVCRAMCMKCGGIVCIWTGDKK